MTDAGGREIRQRQCVLVVDDDKAVLNAIVRILNTIAIPTIATHDVDEAIIAIQSGLDVDLIISDIRMPKADGFAMLSRMRDGAGLPPWTQVIFITGCMAMQNAIQAIRMDAVDFIAKPFDKNIFTAAVGRALQRARDIRRKSSAAPPVAAAPQAELAQHASEIERLLRDLRGQLERTPVPAAGAEQMPDRGERPGDGGPRPGMPRILTAPLKDLSAGNPIVSSLMAAHAARVRHFPAAAVDDAAWNMLLELAAARAKGQTVSVSSLCHASGVPASTALRRLEGLCAARYVARQPDRQDRRRIVVHLTETAEAKLIAYLNDVQAALSARLLT